MAFKNLAEMSSRNLYEKAVVWLRVLYTLLFDQK